MKDYHFGITVNDPLIHIEEIDVNASIDQIPYVVNVIEAYSLKGNGYYDIKILSSTYDEGLPLGNWILKSGRIVFDWGTSTAYFTLIDEKGEEIEKIEASSGRGVANNNLAVPPLVKSIIPKAQEIIARYPSARLYKVFNDFKVKAESISKRNIQFITMDKLDNFLCEFEEKFFNPLKNLFDSYNILKGIIEDENNEKAKKLLISAKHILVETINKIYST